MFFNKLKFLVVWVFLSSAFLGADPLISTRIEPVFSTNDILSYARENLSQEGQLVINHDGYVYLKVDDSYIHSLFPMLGLEESGYKKPPYFRQKEAPGAHISVIYVEENVVPIEIGETFRFKMTDILDIHVSYDTSYVVIVVKSEELENLRIKYGLKPLLKGHAFHISIAKKKLKFS